MEAKLSIPHQYVGQAGNIISRFLTVQSGFFFFFFFFFFRFSSLLSFFSILLFPFLLSKIQRTGLPKDVIMKLPWFLEITTPV